jgi:branched-chain amino acid transport system substrate-binding protein
MSKLPPPLTLVFSFIWAIFSSVGQAENVTKIGFIGSLSSFASEYGQASLEGVQLALEEINKNKHLVDLVIEDDGSDPKRSVQAFNKLVSLDKVNIVVSGTWWATSLVAIAEKSNTLLLSTETLEENSSPHGKTYFVFQGELNSWIDVYRPTIEARGWKRAAMVHFVSSFGETLRDRLKGIFSEPGRTFAGTVEYSTIDLSDAPTIALKIKKMNPDVLYIDAQPQSLPVIMKRLEEIGAGDIAIIANNVLKVSLEQKLFSPERFKELYYAQRKSYAEPFLAAYKDKYKKEPKLNADLGYYAMKLAAKASEVKDTVAFMHSSPVVDGMTFTFNEKNLFNGAPQEVICVKKPN